MLRDDGTIYFGERDFDEFTPEELKRLGIKELSEERKREVCRILGIEYKEQVKRNKENDFNKWTDWIFKKEYRWIR